DGAGRGLHRWTRTRRPERGQLSHRCPFGARCVRPCPGPGARCRTGAGPPQHRPVAHGGPPRGPPPGRGGDCRAVDKFPAVRTGIPSGSMAPSPSPLESYLDAFVAHLRAERGLSPRTVEAYARDLAAYLEWLGPTGVLRPDAVRQEHVRGHLAT